MHSVEGYGGDDDRALLILEVEQLTRNGDSRSAREVGQSVGCKVASLCTVDGSAFSVPQQRLSWSNARTDDNRHGLLLPRNKSSVF